MLPSEQPESPRRKANIFSILTFAWLLTLLGKGFRKDLALEDLYRCLPCDETRKLADRLESAWFKEIEKAKRKNEKKKAGDSENKGADGGGGDEDPKKKVKRKHEYEPSLVIALTKVFGPKFAFYGIFLFIAEAGIRIVQAIVLGYLLDYFNNPTRFPTYQGYLFSLGVVLTAVLYANFDHPFKFAVQHMGMQMRIALTSLIYRKSLRVSQYAMGQTQAGQVTNFLSSDMNRFDIFFSCFHYTWVAPIQLLNCIVVLYFHAHLGYASLAGLILCFVFVPFQGFMGSRFGALRKETAEKTDERLLTLQEILMAMQVIKMYTWEKPFSNIVSESREAEIIKLKKTAVYRALNQSFFSLTSRTTLFITLMIYVVLLGEGLTAKKVYVTLSLYNVVQAVLTVDFPLAIITCAETLVALTRIKKFLMMEEKSVPDEENSQVLKRVRRYEWKFAGEDDEDGKSQEGDSQFTYTTASFDTTPQQIVGVWVWNIGAKWDPGLMSEMCFHNVSFEVRAGELLALIGPTASGKSSILSSLLYELPVNSGSIKTFGKVAYSAQEAWLFNGSVRENILFGKPYNSGWYDEVTAACALTRDFQLLPYGDRTLVGEKGSELSGGQKARVTLARAVYSDADIYLMDDPLSAVDAQVGRHIVEKCIFGLLKHKCRVLVTHQLQYIKLADKIVVMLDGHVAHSGDFKSLQRSGIPFLEMVNPGQAQELAAVTQSIENSVSTIAVSPDKGQAQVEVNHEAKIHLDDPLEDEEFVKKGGINLPSTFYKYFHAGSSLRTIISMFIFYIFTQALVTGTDLWLQFWVKTEQARHSGTMHSRYSKIYFIHYIQTHKMIRVAIYTSLIGCLIIIYQVRTQLFFRCCMKSSVVVYDQMFYGVVRSPISFFERTPVGRILNRFAKDISIIDEMLPTALYDVTEIFMQTFGILILITINAHMMSIPCILFLVILYYLRKFYFRTAIAIKRLEGVARSPIFSHLNNTLIGLSTIRAFGVEEKFTRNFEEIHDVHNSTWFAFLCATRWLGLTVDWVIGVFMTVVALNFLINLDVDADSSLVGSTLASALMMMTILQWGMRQTAEMENHLIAFERVSEYCDLESEAALDSSSDKKPPGSWPSNGEIRIQNLCLRYGSENNGVTVLKNINCVINGGEKIGIVGRTGAGKSSLIKVLFRLVEPTSGYIEIDGIETTSIGLHDLRGKISIIPQDPVIFRGTIRSNLDPFSEFTDAQLWNSLQEVHLRETVKHMEGGLDSGISEGGSNFSAGQKQLLCLARCILKRNKILVLDEATASIDPETDKLIQKAIRRNFNEECTVLTIAHRLHTVMDSDRILLMESGYIREFDEPQVLLNDRHSMLYNLVKQTGKTEASKLAQIAKIAAMQRRPVEQQQQRALSQDSLPKGSQRRPSDEVSSTVTVTTTVTINDGA